MSNFIPTFFLNKYEKTRYKIPFTEKLVTNDKEAYKVYPKFNFVYDKYFVAKSQGLKCGFMNQKPKNYPVFIKPRIGLGGGNKDCFKIRNIEEFNEFEQREDMFWCEYIDGQEASSDFVIKNGNVLYELNYKIDKKPGTIIGVKTIVSNENKCPFSVKQWIRKYLGGFSGPCNIQYIDDKIIEVGLRFDEGGNYLQWTNNTVIIKRINKFIDEGKWIPLTEFEKQFQTYYLYRCFKEYPIIYFLPAPLVIFIMEIYGIENYNFYIDNDKKGITFLGIATTDDEKGKRAKNIVELLMTLMNYLLFILIFINILFFIFGKPNYNLIILTTLLFFTRFLNAPKFLR